MAFSVRVNLIQWLSHEMACSLRFGRLHGIEDANLGYILELLDMHKSCIPIRLPRPPHTSVGVPENG